MLKYLLPLLALTYGCAASEDTNCEGKYRIETEWFSDHEIVEIYQSVDKLNAWVGKPVVDIAPEHECAIMNRALSYPNFGVYRHASGNVEIDAIAIRDFYRDGTFDIQFRGIVMHELLHSFGVKHQTYDIGIMNPQHDATKFSYGDRIACIAAHLCM